MVTKKEFHNRIEYRNENGQLHRLDGPAREYSEGDNFWYINGILHREDGPAVEWSDGSKEWFINGLRHRENGPAREWTDGYKEWYLNGECYFEQQWQEEVINIKLDRLKNYGN